MSLQTTRMKSNFKWMKRMGVELIVDIVKDMASAFILTSQEYTTACTRTISMHRLVTFL
jgi:hypothetical protein